MNKLIKHIQLFNKGREPERLAMKYRNMRASAFVYLRATCHLFPSQLSDVKALSKAPAVWSCGDLHLENFGSYKGDNRLTYFDINDFDESALTPASWDLVRLLTSVRLASAEISLKANETRALLDALLTTYFRELQQGSARWLERDTTDGPVRDLLHAAAERKRKDFLDSRCTWVNGDGDKGGNGDKADSDGRKKRTILIDGKRSLKASKQQRDDVIAFMRRFAKANNDPKFYEVLDVARRVAGNGSLGLDRFVILVRGRGNPDGNYLLDLKQAPSSALAPALKLRQPTWPSEGERVVKLTQRSQATPIAFLHAVKLDGQDYVLRDLQPSADRVSFSRRDHDDGSLTKLMVAIGQCTAWSHLRGSGRLGSAIADELIEFGSDAAWRKLLRNESADCAKRIADEWKVYSQAFDDGVFE